MSHLEAWSYGKTLEKVSGPLLEVAGSGWLEMACELLAEAIGPENGDSGQGADQVDDHAVWRSAIEDHSQNGPVDDIRDHLVVLVRDVAEKLASESNEASEQVISTIESRPQTIFRRLALHVLRRNAPLALDLTSERLTNKDYFDDSWLHHEYYLLLNECFGILEPADQNVILGWIDESGNDFEKVRERLGEWRNGPVTDDEVEEAIARSYFERLYPIREHLTGLWRGKFEALSERFETPEHPDFIGYGSGGVWAGYPSPKSAEELKGMSVSQIAGYLSSWKPKPGIREASPEGLAQQVTAVVRERPSPFADAAHNFVGLPATYVRALLDGLADAAKRAESFSWTPVLELCDWILRQPRGAFPSRHHEDSDPSWGWTRKSILRLVEHGIDKSDATIAIELRPRVWGIISELTEDEDPAPDTESTYGGTNMDPATLSINTVRGDAMHAVVKYGLWLRRHIEGGPNSEDRLKQGFAEMPEVQGVLERHLDVGHDPSLAIRAVYGQWFPWITLLDEKWAARHADHIFPMGETQAAYWEAAWGTYVAFCPPYDNTYRILGAQYQHAVDRIGHGSDQRVGLDERPESRLAEHLLTLFWRGQLPLHHGLMKSFYEIASDGLRAHAIVFVGRSLCNTQKEVPADVLRRLKELWEWRLSTTSQEPEGVKHGSEMAAFSWWFKSGRFDDAWAIANVIRALEVGGSRGRRDAHLLIERLAELVKSMPHQAVEVAQMLVEGAEDSYVVIGSRDELCTILRVARDSENEIASQMALELANRLMAKGYSDYRDFLGRSGTVDRT